MGGMVAAIENGFARQLIDQAAFAWSDQIDKKERLVVGVNEHADDEPPHMHLFEVGEEVRQREIDRLNQVKARRDGRAVEECARGAAPGRAGLVRQNLMPPILAAVRAYCSIGEICGVLREVFGEFHMRRGPMIAFVTGRIHCHSFSSQVDATDGTITLDHDSKRNALCKALIEELISALDEMRAAGVRSVILRARPGAAVWSAGHDVSELPTHGRDPARV